MADWSITTKGAEALRARFLRAPNTVDSYITKNLITLGGKLQQVMRRVMRPVRYRGELEQSVGWQVQKAPPLYTLRVGPTAAHAPYVFFGTRPHWTSINNLKAWAEFRGLNVYAVQAGIAAHGTSVHIERIGLGDGHGGFDFVSRTLGAADARQVIERTAERIPLDVVNALDNG